MDTSNQVYKLISTITNIKKPGLLIGMPPILDFGCF